MKITRQCFHLFAIGWFFCAGLAAADPPGDVTPNRTLEAWFKSLKQPGSQSPCCSISDCRFTAYQERNGHFEVTIEGWPYVVPEEAVMHSTENPTGRAVVCYTFASFGLPLAKGEIRTSPQDKALILCFIPEKSLS